MYVAHIIKTDSGEERVFHAHYATRDEAHAGAVALADSLVGTDNVVHVERGYQPDEAKFMPRVHYDIPPTDSQRNPQIT